MFTILAFINLAGALFNCVLCIFIFSSADDLKIKPERASELCDTLSLFFPMGFFVLSFNLLSAIIYGNWFQAIFILPMFLYDLHFFMTKKHKVYYSLGEKLPHYANLSFNYKCKFMYYLCLSFINLLKLIISATNMVSYQLFGDTNFFTNIIKIIGLY